MFLPIQNEDLTTEKLAELLRLSSKIRHAFLKFLYGNEDVADEHAARDLQVDTQHRFSSGKSGRFDLLLHKGPTGIIVECKTRDRPKVFQLEKYHKYWTEKHGQKPGIFWLVRKEAGPMGINPYLTREVLWDHLHLHLQDLLRSQLDESEWGAIGRFCQYLEEAMILLQPNERKTYTPRNKGYDYEVAERFLEAVGASFSDSTYELSAPVNAVTHRLFIGRKAWVTKFEDGWIHRVVLQFKAHKVSRRFFWHGNIMLYNRHNVVDPAFAIRNLPKWAPICTKAGLRLLRNLGGEWSGKFSYEIEPPFVVTRPVKYFHAPLPDEVWPVSFFSVQDEEEMKAEGVRIVRYLYQVVDQF